MEAMKRVKQHAEAIGSAVRQLGAALIALDREVAEIERKQEPVKPDPLRYRVLLRGPDGAEMWVPNLDLESARQMVAILLRNGRESAHFAAMP
jgi:hypothetical protein